MRKARCSARGGRGGARSEIFTPMPLNLVPPAHLVQRSVSDGKSLAVEEGSVYADITVAKGGGHPTATK